MVLTLCLPAVILFVRRTGSSTGYRPTKLLLFCVAASEIGIMVVASIGITHAGADVVLNIVSILAAILHNVMEVLVDLGYMDAYLKHIIVCAGFEDDWIQRFDI